MSYEERMRRYRQRPDAGVIKIRYSRKAFDSMMEKVKLSILYTVEEKNVLCKMIQQMREEDWLLYMVEIYKEDQFNFQIYDFDKYRRYIVAEVYNELLAQLLEANKDCEDIGYEEIREWFYGMTFDITMINMIDRKFKEIDVKIRY